MSKERPILFSGPMVRGILKGRKTQTRRIIKYAPIVHPEYNEETGDFEQFDGDTPVITQRCPYGKQGDHLWVRETFALHPTMIECGNPAVFYKANDTILPTNRWRPSIHMPRWASRVLLEITDIRVERLQDISEEDAQAEGVGKLPPFMDEGGSRTAAEMLFRSGFRDIWESINGPDSWNANPFVWVISFRRIEPIEARAVA